MSQGVDYSFGRPGGEALRAAGKSFAVRYCPYPKDGGKGLTADEVAELHGNGISIVLVFESTGGRTKDGQAAGQADAQLAKNALTSLGFPGDRPCYFAVDYDSTEGDQVAIDDYLRGCADILGYNRVGVYGSYYVCMRCHQNSTARWLWQTFAWSGGQKYLGIDLYQYLNGQTINGAEVDFVESYNPDYGQWAPAQKEDQVTDQQDFQNCFITQASRWPSQDEITAWQASGDTPYHWVQTHAPNPAVEDLKQQVTTQGASITSLQMKLEDEQAVNANQAKANGDLTNQVAGLNAQISSLQLQLQGATRPVPTVCPHDTMTGWQLIKLGLSQLFGGDK